MNDRSIEKPRVEWQVVRDVVCGLVTVRLKKLPLGRPRFSIQIGTGSGAEFRPFLPVDGKIVWQDVLSAFAAAESEARDETEAADRAWEARQAKKPHDPKVRDEGKTAREKAKRAQWEKNRADKAEENRRRAASGGKSSK